MQPRRRVSEPMNQTPDNLIVVLDIGSAHRHDAPWIEAKFGKPLHRQRARFELAKILPHPDQRPTRTDARRKTCDEAGCGSTVPAAFGKHFVHGAAREPALQSSIGLAMTERDPV